MNWFHPVGGPVLLLPRSILDRWRGQHPERGHTRLYQAVQAGLSDGAWVGLDIGGLALAEAPAIGVAPLDGGGLRLVVKKAAPTLGIAETVGAASTTEPTGRHIPWPGGAGLLFDAIEDGATVQDGLNEPVAVELPAGTLTVQHQHVREGVLDLLVLDLLRDA